MINVRDLGRRFDVARQRSAVRCSIGLVFQQPTLDEALSAEQNLRFQAYAYGVPADVRERRIGDLLTLVERCDRRKERMRTFSGGMKRRLKIARGLLHHPRVVFPAQTVLTASLFGGVSVVSDREAGFLREILVAAVWAFGRQEQDRTP